MSDKNQNTDKESQFAKFLDIQTQEAKNRELEIKSREFELQSSKEIRLKEIESANDIEKAEVEKIRIFAEAQNSSESRVFKIALLFIGTAIALLGLKSILSSGSSEE
ncbi:hypothetical protein [Leptospira idonii]|uniref:Uncharacterized protein n=1 Tax=Leptospira idonii TaxID=1193500 RepID=A0A4R9M044_9LEPT|nr:hypothetical protein [Leptospira idonii]TGN19392.1 hypothetical protein EHS15_08595 [Leptospira idonii]